MHVQLSSRIQGIRSILMGHHSAGQGMASATIGSEREFLIREFLSKVLPPQFRFGSGVIIDSYGKKTGQVDGVVEWPFLPSFPTPSADQRLYLAESVAFVIEVKSHLSEKWPEVLAKSKEVLELRRKLGTMMQAKPGGFSLGVPRDSSIPLVAIGYKGYATSESLKRAVLGAPADQRPNVAFVVESGAYFNRVGGERCFDGDAGFFALCADTAGFARSVISADPQLDAYVACAQVS